MILNLSFTYRACMDYILAGQFMYMFITTEAILLVCAILYVQYFLFIQSFNNQLNSTLIFNGVHILYIHTYILISISISIDFKLIFKQKAKNITESPHKSTVHPTTLSISIHVHVLHMHLMHTYLIEKKRVVVSHSKHYREIVLMK